MIKKSLTYLAVAFANLVLLSILLALWTDRLELIFNDWVRPREFLKISGFTIVGFISVSLVVRYLKKTNILAPISKINISVLLTFLISSYLYIDYSIKIVNNKILHGQFRNQIADKIKPSGMLAYGTKAEKLTSKEYQQIIKMNRFPPLPDEASNINYTYAYDGFLPDYFFTITYDLPSQATIETIDSTKGGFSKYQSFVTVENIKRVTYSEIEK